LQQTAHHGEIAVIGARDDGFAQIEPPNVGLVQADIAQLAPSLQAECTQDRFATTRIGPRRWRMERRSSFSTTWTPCVRAMERIREKLEALRPTGRRSEVQAGSSPTSIRRRLQTVVTQFHA
jgi:hypothetical protein